MDSHINWPKYLLPENVFYVILALLPFHGFFTIWVSSIFGGDFIWRSWPEVLMVYMGAVLFYRFLKDRKNIGAVFKDPLVLLILGYIALVMVASAVYLCITHTFGKANYLGFVIDVRYFIFFILAYVTFAHIKLSEKYDAVMYRILIIPSLIVATFALLQAFVLPKDILKHFGFSSPKFNPVLTIDGNKNFIRARSFLRGPNELGAYLILSMLVLCKAYAINVNKKLVSLAIAIVSVAVFVSYSRSAWIGLIVAIAIYFADLLPKCIRRITRKSSGKVLLISVLLIVSIGVFDVLKSNVFNVLILHDDKNNSVISSTDVRIRNYKAIMSDTLSRPFGRGPGTSGPASVYGNPRIPDNYFIQVIQEYGIVGILLFLTVNIYLAWRLFKMRGDTWAKIALAALLGISISNLFLHTWADDTVSLLYWGYTGWVFGVYKNQYKKRKSC